MRNLLALSLVVVLAAGGVLVGCQGYQFEEVEPKAIGTVKQAEPITGQQQPAKILLVLDRSGSMKTLASSDTQYGCADDALGNGYNANGTCKWITLRDKLAGANGFLDQTATTARHGLMMSADPNSSDLSCGAGTLNVGIAASAGGNISNIKSTLNNAVPGGGTPTAASLRNAAADSTFVAEEPGTKMYVLLVTDGLPNCNASIGTCKACTNSGSPTDWCGDRRNCLDDDALVSAVKALKNKNVETFVVGFGSAFQNAAAKAVLNAAADVSGQATSDSVHPDARFYLADDDASLQKVFDAIKIKIQACNFSLSQAPASEAMLEVSVTNKNDNTETTLVKTTSADPAAGDWYFNDTTLTSITITDEWCQKIQNAAADTYVLNFLSVQEL